MLQISFNDDDSFYDNDSDLDNRLDNSDGEVAFKSVITTILINLRPTFTLINMGKS